MALPRFVRLKNRRLFKQVLQSGHALVSCPYYRLLAIKRPVSIDSAATAAPVQWGCIVSKKVSKRAPVRNRIKRQLRHVFRPYLVDSVTLNEYQALVCIARQAMADADSPPTADQLAWPLKRAVARLQDKTGPK
ncbi:MAG: ribonuclease P protein component [Cyanobacteria bacterium HKST-UBA06]|nr:ribonuclease P protein component [Cyanobacteria bacterium HKST-UBA06]